MATKVDYMNKEATKKLIELLIKEMYTQLPVISTTVPVNKEEGEKYKEKTNVVPTVYAVFEAIQKINHSRIKFVTANSPDQSFKDAIGEAEPEELVLYVFLEETEVDKEVELYVYNSQVGDYLLVGGGKNDEPVVDFENYWSKDELDVDDFWKKTDFSQQELLTKSTADDKYATRKELANYLKTEDAVAISPTEVEELYNKVKPTIKAARPEKLG